jgi:hypothetical protein
MNSGGASRADGSGFNFVGASGQIYAGYDEWKSTMSNSNRVFAEFLQNNNLTMDEALRQAAAGKFDPANILNTEKPAGMAMGGIVGAYAEGGMVGNGIWNKDSVLARFAGGGNIALAGGEFVTTARAVNDNTFPMLDYINRTGSLPTASYAAMPAPMDMTPLVNLLSRAVQRLEMLIEVGKASGDLNAEGLIEIRDELAAGSARANKVALRKMVS